MEDIYPTDDARAEALLEEGAATDTGAPRPVRCPPFPARREWTPDNDDAELPF